MPLYLSIKRKLNRRLIRESRCDERLKSKDEGSTRLTYTVENRTSEWMIYLLSINKAKPK